MPQSERESFTMWAVGIGDPCVRRDLFELAGAQIVVETTLVGEFLAAVAATLPADDVWRTLNADASGRFEAWWDDCYPDDDAEHWGARLAPVPTRTEADVIGWAFAQPMFDAGSPPGWDRSDVEWAVRCLVARFRAIEPGVEIREFLLDCADGAWAVTQRRSMSAVPDTDEESSGSEVVVGSDDR